MALEGSVKYKEADTGPLSAEADVVLVKDSKLEAFFRLSLQGFFAILGAVFLCLAWTWGLGATDNFATFFFGGAGVVFLGLVGWLKNPAHSPDRLLFDNARGALRVEVHENNNVRAVYELPYTDIETFKTVARLKTFGSSSRSMYHSTPLYGTELCLRDGSSWRLTESRNETKEEGLTQSLQERVRLKQPPLGPPTLTASAFQVEQRDGNERYTWSMDRPFSQKLGTWLILLGLGVMSCMLFSFPSFHLLRWLFPGFFFVASLAALIQFQKNQHGRFVVEVSDSQLLFFQEGGVGRWRDVTVALDQIAAIHFSFNTPEARQEVMRVETHEERAENDLVAEGKLAPRAFLGVFGRALLNRGIPIATLPFGARLALKQRLRASVEERTGRKIL